MKSYDVVVIGAGPGGYIAAIRCAQLGLSTACIDKRLDDKNLPVLGGTCLNTGCIPSKALLDSSHHYHNLTHLLPQHGISVDAVKLDVTTMQQRKTDIVHTLTQGIRSLFKKNKIAAYGGTARFISRNQIGVHDGNGALVETLSGAHIIIATGSTPIALEAAPVDNEWIFDSEGALSFPSVPKRLGVIGAGAIGLELGSVWSRLGSQVVILEAMETFLSVADRDIAKEALHLYQLQDLDIRLGCKVVKVDIDSPNSLCISYRDQRETAIQCLEMDRLIVTVGRQAYTEGLALKQVGIQTDDHGRIKVDGQWRTSAEGIYALGDVIRGPMLAHKASEEGVAVAELIGGGSTNHCYSSHSPLDHLHPTRNCMGRRNRGETKHSRGKLPGGKISLLSQWTSPQCRDVSGICQDHRRGTN